MTDRHHVMPRRTRHVEVADFGTEFVVFDPRNRMAHHVSGWPAVVFDACDGTTAVAELAAEATDYWHGDIDEARERIEEVVRGFEHLGILEGTDAMAPPPCIGCPPAAIAGRRRWFARR